MPCGCRGGGYAELVEPGADVRLHLEAALEIRQALALVKVQLGRTVKRE